MTPYRCYLVDSIPQKRCYWCREVSISSTQQQPLQVLHRHQRQVRWRHPHCRVLRPTAPSWSARPLLVFSSCQSNGSRTCRRSSRCRSSTRRCWSRTPGPSCSCSELRSSSCRSTPRRWLLTLCRCHRQCLRRRLLDANQLIARQVWPAYPLTCSGVRQLHLKVFNAIQVYAAFLISDIRTLWRSWLSARVSECQKLKMQRRPAWQSVTSCQHCPLKG